MKRIWIAQNAQFEYKWVWHSTKSYDHNFEDTEVLARLHHKRKGVGKLEVLSKLYLGLNIKEVTNLDKDHLTRYPIEQVLEYNALDAWSTKLIYDILVEKLTDTDVDNYIRIIDTIKSTTAMELAGLDVDQTRSEELQKEFLRKLEDIEDKAKQIKEVKMFEAEEHKTLKLSAPEMVGHVIVSYCGVQLPKTKGSEKEGAKQVYSTDEKDLTALAGKHPFVDLVLDYREVAKLLSTYIAPILSGQLLGLDGLLHPSYTAVHTATYRLSSQDPNIQNFPKRSHAEIRSQIVAPPGYIIAAFDYGQLEGRVIAMFSKDPMLKKAFVEDDDIHWKWLYRIIDLYPAYVDRLAKISHETEEKKILKAGRTIIKTDFVFASFYGSKVASLSKRTGIPYDIMERVLDEFWDCIDPHMRVLTTDLRWIEAKDVVPGQELIGFDENLNPSSSRKSKQRRYRVAKVVETRRLIKKCVKVNTVSGSYICSSDHLWLAKNSKQGDLRWIKAEDLHVRRGNYVGERSKVVITRLCHPWNEDKSYEAGYLAGVFDGEASSGTRSIGFSQNEGIVLDRVKELLQMKGFIVGKEHSSFYTDKEGKSSPYKHISFSLCGGRGEILRFIGSIRPPRLLSKSKSVWEGTMLYAGKNTQDLTEEVISVEEIGEHEVIAIHTDTHTFIAEGLLSHNCYALAKKWVDNQFTLYQNTGAVESLQGRIRNEVLPGNETCNSPAQGSAAEIVIEAQNALFKKAMTEDLFYLPRVNIHDDLLFLLKDDDALGDYVENIAHEIVLPRFSYVNVPLMTEARVGYNWAALSAIGKFSGAYHQ
jgi:DNA polymerase I-like protein with 3'-5' exonuclease and polymerase domains